MTITSDKFLSAIDTRLISTGVYGEEVGLPKSFSMPTGSDWSAFTRDCVHVDKDIGDVLSSADNYSARLIGSAGKHLRTIRTRDFPVYSVDTSTSVERLTQPKGFERNLELIAFLEGQFTARQQTFERKIADLERKYETLYESIHSTTALQFEDETDSTAHFVRMKAVVDHQPNSLPPSGIDKTAPRLTNLIFGTSAD